MTVVVVGSAMVDVAYRVGAAARASELVLARGRSVDVGGKGLNQAIIAHRAGAEVRYCAGLGRDPAAAIIRGAPRSRWALTAWLVSVPCATDESIVYVASSGENCIVSTDAAAKQLATADVEDVLTRCRRAMSCWCRAISAERSPAFASLVRARQRLDHPQPGADRLRLHRPLASRGHRDPQPDRGADADGNSRDRGGDRSPVPSWRRQRGPDPRGGGALVREGQGRPQRVPAPAVTAVDTTGAGDVLAGVVAAGSTAAFL